MKLKHIISSVVVAAAMSTGITSCDYLDVIPPEQPSLDNTMDSYSQALGFLYTCYRGTTQPIAADWGANVNEYAGQLIPSYTLGDFHCSTDEWMMDDVQYNQCPAARASYTNTLSANNNYNAGKTYSVWMAYCYQFIEKLDKIGIPKGVVPEKDAKLWRAEAKFLLAYYHYCMLRRYGPIAIVSDRTPMDAPVSSYPGRMHYDYCVKWICDRLDEAAAELPIKREPAEGGRATSLICKALKARIMLYAASPLYNGQFPYPEWTNVVETPGYGRELISKKYDRKKWEAARDASLEALALATGQGGRALYYGNSGNETAAMIKTMFIPVDDVDDDFKRTVLRLRNILCVRELDGNTEAIWATQDYCNVQSLYNQRMVRNPIPKTASAPNGATYAYSTMGATLATNLRFLTKDGLQPENDPNFCTKDKWYKSAGYADDMSEAGNPALRSHIINLCKNREPRFYAWLSFDGGDYGTLLRYGTGPVHVNLLSSDEQGFDPVKAPRDYCPTGFPMQKWINPRSFINGNAGANFQYAPTTHIRLAELYLNLAECYAELGDMDNALKNINIIRDRAGVKALTREMVASSGKSIVEWARDERSIELFDEMHRYFDIRRWCKGKLMANGQRQGLNAHVANPSFEEFNRPTQVNMAHLYSWGDRMYLYPIDAKELYSNPQFVQSPGY